jgi:hypothetical protein
MFLLYCSGAVSSRHHQEADQHYKGSALQALLLHIICYSVSEEAWKMYVLSLKS